MYSYFISFVLPMKYSHSTDYVGTLLVSSCQGYEGPFMDMQFQNPYIFSELQVKRWTRPSPSYRNQSEMLLTVQYVCCDLVQTSFSNVIFSNKSCSLLITMLSFLSQCNSALSESSAALLVVLDTSKIHLISASQMSCYEVASLVLSVFCFPQHFPIL